jgi:hypothetical protein
MVFPKLGFLPQISHTSAMVTLLPTENFEMERIFMLPEIAPRWKLFGRSRHVPPWIPVLSAERWSLQQPAHRASKLRANNLALSASCWRQKTLGAFSIRSEAGNFGNSILSRFTVTFDSRSEILCLQP